MKDRQTYKFKNVFASESLKSDLTKKDLKFCKKILKLKESYIGFISPREKLCSFEHNNLQIDVVDAYSMMLVVGDGSGMSRTNIFPHVNKIQLFVANDSIFAVKQEAFSSKTFDSIAKIKILNQPIPYHNGESYEIISSSFDKSNHIVDIPTEEWNEMVDSHKSLDVKNNAKDNNKSADLDIDEKIKIIDSFVKEEQNTKDLDDDSVLNKNVSANKTKECAQTLNNINQDEDILSL